MAFDFLFNQSKDEPTQEILASAQIERGTVFVTSSNYRHAGVFLSLDESNLYISHGLSRDEVFKYLRGRKLKIQITAEGQLYEGYSKLVGLGIQKDQQALKVQLPKKLIKNDPRRSFRLSTIGLSTWVSFSSDEKNIFSGRLMDISMTGAAIRPDTKYDIDDIKLADDIPIHTDIRLESNWSISTTSSVKNYSNFKIGIEFGGLDKKTKKNLYKYIQKMRRLETEKPAAPAAPKQEPKRTNHSKPCALIFGQDEKQIDLLRRSLKTRFEVIQYPLKISEVRNKIQLEKPDICLLEIDSHNQDTYRRLKKVKAAFKHKTPFMLYTDKISEEHLQVYFPQQSEAVLDLRDYQTLKTYKAIAHFIKTFQ